MKTIKHAGILVLLCLLFKGCEKNKEEEPPNNAPIAYISASPRSGIVPLEVQFDASGSTDPDEDELSYSWEFGDGTAGENAGPEAEHLYSEEGTYLARVTVTDEGGLSSSAEVVDAGLAARLHPQSARPDSRTGRACRDHEPSGNRQ